MHEQLARLRVAVSTGRLPRDLGYWLRAHRDARCGALVLRCATSRAPRRWRVDSVDGVDISLPRGRARENDTYRAGLDIDTIDTIDTGEVPF